MNYLRSWFPSKARKPIDDDNLTSKDSVVTAEEDDTRIPVTILSGFLGSGKTTLLKYILESNEHGMKIAVIVNDMAELNIDAALIQQAETAHATAVVANGDAVGETISSTPDNNLGTNDNKVSTLSDNVIIQTEREVVSLQNGCICCTLRGDLIREIARIQKHNEFDYVLIESTGIAEPQQVAEAFCFDPATEQLATSEESMLWMQARLDTCVTVIDAYSVQFHINSLQQFSDKYKDGLDLSTEDGVREGQKCISQLLFDQIEFANVILLNKTDLVTEEQQNQTYKLVKRLNPTAHIISTQYCKVDLAQILNTKLFNMNAAAESPGWLKEIKKLNVLGSEATKPTAKSESEEYGISSFIYRSRKPFHPQKISKWVGSIMHFGNELGNLTEEERSSEQDTRYNHMIAEYGNLLRTKGFIWVAGQDTLMMGMTQCGRLGGILPVMPWYTLIPEDQWGVTNQKDFEMIKGKFEEPHGDRRQEIVFIGIDLNEKAITEALDNCLLTEKELEHYKFYKSDGYP